MAAITQTALSANTVSSVALPAQGNRRYLAIQNYSSSTVSIFVKFGGVATAGAAGEYEVSPGAVYILGTLPSPQDFYNSNVLNPISPTSSVNVITAASSANGSISTATTQS